MSSPGSTDAVTAIAAATKAGTSFVFGYVGGGPLPFELKTPGADFILGFQALPVVLVMSVLSSLLFYWGIMPPIVRGFSWALERTLDVGGAVGLSTAANIFVGQVEAPLFIRPYLAKLSRARNVRGDDRRHGRHRRHGVRALRHHPCRRDPRCRRPHRGRLDSRRAGGDPDQPDHGARTRNERRTGGTLGDVEQPASSTMDAIVKGTAAGLELLLNIVAMLIVFIALVYLANAILGLLPDFLGTPLTLQRLLGWIMAPVCWLMGVPWSQAVTAGGLMGIKTILNELVAYLQLAALPEGTLDPALAADHALRHVRLRQFRLARHYDCGARHHVPGKAR